MQEKQEYVNTTASDKIWNRALLKAKAEGDVRLEKQKARLAKRKNTTKK